MARAGNDDVLTEDGLVGLQKEVVDPRFAANRWRDFQNCVGRTLAPRIEDIHLIPPRPDDIDFLMQAWLAMAQHLAHSEAVPPIAAAALVAWSFVYLHPFEDGNGRIHRFLIHHILAARHFGPAGVLLPVSAVLLNRPADYDASLETFSVPLKSRTDYSLATDGTLSVRNATLDHFRYIDFTTMAEALHDSLEETIEKEIPAELEFLRSYEAARIAMRDVVDLPEPTANLFLRFVDGVDRVEDEDENENELMPCGRDRLDKPANLSHARGRVFPWQNLPPRKTKVARRKTTRYFLVRQS